jgi:regulator of RNase E activity RraA
MIGFRINADVSRPDPDLVKRFEGAASSNLADAMGRFNFMDSGIRPRSALALCGAAVTVNCRPGDNLMVHKALEVAEPGDIDKDGPGEINVDIACGGVVVHPGDIVVGDNDGVVVVPQRDAKETLERVAELVAREQERINEIRAGKVFKPAIDEALRAKGVIE